MLLGAASDGRVGAVFAWVSGGGGEVLGPAGGRPVAMPAAK